MLDRLIWRATVGIGTAVAFCIALATICLAQVYQSGLVTPGHAAMWSTTGVIMDGGSTALPTMPNTRLSSLGIVNAGTTDCRWTSYTQPLAQFCLGFDGSGNGLITYSNLGAPATGTINYNINGAAGTLGGASPVNTPGTVVDVRQYGVAGGGIFLTNGQIGAGSSTGICDLYSVSYNFGAASPTPVGQYAVVFGAGAAAGTLAGGKITAVNGNHATLTTCASTTIASSAHFIVAPDIAAAMTAAANNPQGYAIHVPTGIYCISSQITQAPTGPAGVNGHSLVTVYGDGTGATILIACQPMTTTGTNEAVWYRNSTFGGGGGLRYMTIDAAGLAKEAVFWAGGGGGVATHGALVFDVAAKNATVADWQCGDGSHQASGNTFMDIQGSTDSNTFTSGQEAQYNFFTHATGCTDMWVSYSVFSNASAANVYDDGPSQNNHYDHDHPFNVAGYTPPYQFEVSGGASVTDAELDGGGTTAAVYAVGNNNKILGNYEYINGGWSSSGNMIELAAGAQALVDSNFSRTSDSMPAADVVVQDGSSAAGTIVSDNPGASYGYPGVSCPSGVTAATVTTSADGKVTHC